MTRPICVHCGKPYGSRVTEEQVVEHAQGTPEPPYTGNLQITKVTRYQRVTSLVRHKPTRELSHQWADLEADEASKINVVRRCLWDGETWSTPYMPFCTLRCALDYARKAYRQSQLRRVG